MPDIDVRRGMPDVSLSRAQFEARLRARFYDPAFDGLAAEIDRIVEAAGFETGILDLSRLASEYGRIIYPCKACVSTAQPLCHWPCSCYPNHALGQQNDWMAEIYPKWVAAHGVMIVCPVN
jgi:multimeric flavodoxin WrbA